MLGRDGYYNSVSANLVSAADVVQSDLNDAAVAKVPFSAIPIRVNGAAGGYHVHVQSDALSWHSEANGEQDAHVQVMAVALSTKYAILGHRLQSMTVHSSNINAGTENHDAALEIDFAAPRHTKVVRFVVRDAITGNMGTYDLPADQ